VYSQLRCSAFGGVLHIISCILSSDAQPSAECFILFRVFLLRWLLWTSNIVLYIQNYFSGKLWVLCHLLFFLHTLSTLCILIKVYFLHTLCMHLWDADKQKKQTNKMYRVQQYAVCGILCTLYSTFYFFRPPWNHYYNSSIRGI
jgi:hypothetical protein